MPVEKRSTYADAASGGVRFSLPLRAGSATAEVRLEPAHCERLFRIAAYHAVREELIDPKVAIFARLRPATVREWHGDVSCLESCRVEVLDAAGAVLTTVAFPRRVFAAFAVARALRVVAEGTADGAGLGLAYSLHAVRAEDEPFPVALPALAPASLDALCADATPHGTPDDRWIASFVGPAVRAGLADMEELSRASGLEVAARIHARVGYDAERRTFVRRLDRLVIAHETRATALTVVSTAASWGEFLATGEPSGVRAPTSAHTHLHLPELHGDRDGAPGDHLLAGAEAGAPEDRVTCISLEDIVTHYLVYPDPLSAAFIVSLFPDGREVSLYGYTPGGELRAEPGWWELPEARGTNEREDTTDAKGSHHA
jgi:hypothetical protein